MEQLPSVLSLKFEKVPSSNGGAAQDRSSIANVLMEDPSILVVGTTSGLGVINTRTLKV